MKLLIGKPEPKVKPKRFAFFRTFSWLKCFECFAGFIGVARRDDG